MTLENLAAYSIWILAGIACLFRLFIKKPSRDVAFAMLPYEAGISMLAFVLLFFSLASSVVSALKAVGVDESHSEIMANFASQIAMALCFVLAPSKIESRPKLFPSGAKDGVRLFFKGAIYCLMFFGIFNLATLGWMHFLKFCGADLSQQDAIDLFVNTKSPIYKSILLVSVVALAPLWEELFFRGGLYGALKFKFGAISAALFSALLFSAVHFSFTVLFPIFILGLFFALLYEKYGDIRISMGAHMAFNLVNVLVLTYAPELSDKGF